MHKLIYLTFMLFDFSDVPYRLVLDVNSSNDVNCDGILGLREGIEFAFRVSGTFNWIPLRISFRTDTEDTITEVDYGGYTVPAFGRRAAVVTENVSICGEMLCNATEIQFRWQQITYVEGSEFRRTDLWSVDILKADLITKNGSTDLIQELLRYI